MNRALLLLAALSLGCRAAPTGATERRPLPGAVAAAGSLHPVVSSGAISQKLAPLRGVWLEQLETTQGPAVVTPPLGATTARAVVLGVHGAGDRPEWSCGGWRLAAQGTAFVVCPQGSPLSTTTFAWASERQLAARSDAALQAVLARYPQHADAGALIYAGFSQGATLARGYLLKNAERFRIAVLAEGGYATLRDSHFAAQYRAAGGRRVVLVCGTTACFAQARVSKKVLERAALQVLVIGDERAGHNLNERMQHALQEAWPRISAPFPAPL